MARSKWLLILLLPLLFGFDTRNPFKTRGPFKTAAFTIGGGGTGVEARYASITAESGFVVGCSEPMDGPNGETVNNSPYGSPDNTDSPDASECWGQTTPGDSADWMIAAYQDPPTPPQGQTIVPVTGWGDVQYAAEQTAGRGDWWFGYKPSQIAADFGLTSATICWRYYKQVSSDYQPAQDNTCPSEGTYRNKLMQINIYGPSGPYHQYQIQEDQIGGCSTPGVFTKGIMAGFGSGPGTDGLATPWLSPTVKLDVAVAQPLRVEMCYETTDLATGANGVVKAYVKRLDTGVTSTLDTIQATYGPLVLDESIGADLDHTGDGTSWSGYFMFSVWDDVGGHTIGAACEIEGGC